MISNCQGPSCDEMPCKRAKEEESSYAVRYFMTGSAIYISISPSKAL